MRLEARQSLILVAGTGVTTLLGVAYTLVVGRTLDESALGEFTHALSIVAFCQIALGPINGTVAKFAADYSAKGELGRVRGLTREIAKRVAGYGLPIVIAACVIAPGLASFWQYATSWPMIIAIIMTYVTLLLSVARGALRGLQAFGPFNVNTIFEAAVRLPIGVALLMTWSEPSAGLLAYLIALVATLILSDRQLAASWQGHPVAPVDGRAIRQFTWPLLLLMVTSAGFQNVDMLAVKRFFPGDDAGSFGIAFRLAQAVAVVVTPFNTLMLPLLATKHSAGRAITGTFLRVCGYFLLLAAVPLAAFALWPDEIMNVLFPNKFAGAAAILFPLTLVRLVGHLAHMIGLAGAAANRFGFLWLYVPGLFLETAALILWHDSLGTVVRILLVTQCVTLFATAAWFLAVARR